MEALVVAWTTQTDNHLQVFIMRKVIQFMQQSRGLMIRKV